MWEGLRPEQLGRGANFVRALWPRRSWVWSEAGASGLGCGGARTCSARAARPQWGSSRGRGGGCLATALSNAWRAACAARRKPNKPTTTRWPPSVWVSRVALSACSRLSGHELTTQIVWQEQIGIPREAGTPRVAGLPIRVVRFSGTAPWYGVVNTTASVFDPARISDHEHPHRPAGRRSPGGDARRPRPGPARSRSTSAAATSSPSAAGRRTTPRCSTSPLPASGRTRVRR